MSEDAPALPYRDAKPVGAADFYFAINATFRFIERRLGVEALRRYWAELGARYHRPVSERWKEGGLRAVADYWRAFFDAEPAAVAEISEAPGEVRVEVKTCPAIKHLREQGREIVPCFCQQCYFVSEAMAAPAGWTVRVSGGNGSCVQRFLRRDQGGEPQNLEDITRVP